MRKTIKLNLWTDFIVMSFVEKWKKAAAGQKISSDSSDSDSDNDLKVPSNFNKSEDSEMRLPKFLFKNDGFLDSFQFKFGVEALQKLSANDGIDPKKKEEYLEDKEFEEVFGMNLEKFKGLRLWKQQILKRKVGLF